jgi:pyruvate/2-oxoglutarate dehydrogenase complex dihydrolipoamide acyltransferase (E2) component
LQYDDLCEVFTDKLVAKIPSTATGIVKKINFGDDDVCPVGHALFTIELEDGAEVEVETPV